MSATRARIAAAQEILDKAYHDQVVLHYKEFCYQIARMTSNKTDVLAEDFRRGIQESILAYEKSHEILKDMLK
jgi:hypothetical protein